MDCCLLGVSAIRKEKSATSTREGVFIVVSRVGG